MENNLIVVNNNELELTKEGIKFIKKVQKAKVELAKMEEQLKNMFQEQMEVNGIKKYTSPDDRRNVIPSAHFLFLFSIPSNIEIRKINIHIAHGFKPSTSPITIAESKIGNFLTSFFPKIGMFILLSKSFLLSSLESVFSSTTPKYIPTLSTNFTWE